MITVTVLECPLCHEQREFREGDPVPPGDVECPKADCEGVLEPVRDYLAEGEPPAPVNEVPLTDDTGLLGADGELHATAEEVAAVEDEQLQALVAEKDALNPAPVVEGGVPVQPSLWPPDPFDSAAALEDICAKRRALEALVRQHTDLHGRAAAIKKQIDSTDATLKALISKYDEERRAFEAALARQEQLETAYTKEVTDGQEGQ